MDSSLIETTREELERVSGVDNECVRNVAYPAPGLTVGAEDLEGGDGLGPEDRESTEVRVAFEPDVVCLGLFFFCTRIAGPVGDRCVIQGDRYTLRRWDILLHESD